MPGVFFRFVVRSVCLAAPVLCWDPVAALGQPLFPRAHSIEAIVANADLVLIARVEKIEPVEKIDGSEVHNTVIAIEETLKIDIFTEDRHAGMQMWMPQRESVLADWRDRSCRLLVAFDRDHRDATMVLELAKDKLEVLTTDWKLLRDPDAVIQAAKEALRQQPKSIRRTHVFELQVPRELVAKTSWEPFYNTGGHLRLSVPVDEHLERRAITYLRSKEYERRLEGVRALRYFPSAENIVRVKSLLNDSGWNQFEPPDESGQEVRYYGVRAEAWQTLKVWEVSAEKPVIRERKTAP